MKCQTMLNALFALVINSSVDEVYYYETFYYYNTGTDLD